MQAPLPDPLPLFPLQTVLFPGGLLRLRVFEARYLDLVGHCLRSGEPFGVVAIRDGHEVRRAGEPLLIERVGVLAWVDEVDADQPSLLQLRCHGSERIDLGPASQRADGLWLAPAKRRSGDVPTAIPAPLQPCADALGRAIAALAGQGQQPFLEPHALHDAGWVANRWCELLPMPQAARQRLMELDEPVARLRQVNDFLRREQVIGD